jgi:hypothetical protein
MDVSFNTVAIGEAGWSVVVFGLVWFVSRRNPNVSQRQSVAIAAVGAVITFVVLTLMQP